MTDFSDRFLVFVLLCLALLLEPVVALADGGTVRATEYNEGISVTVFTSPRMLTAGDVDISVLIQDEKTHAPLVDAQVQITVTPRENAYLAERYEADNELATNQLMKVCHVQLEPGWHDVDVFVADVDRHGRLQFAMLVAQAPTKAASFWPWFTWPAVPIFLVAANLLYRCFQPRRSAIINRSVADSVDTLP